jgi:hypothetical protein
MTQMADSGSFGDLGTKLRMAEELDINEGNELDAKGRGPRYMQELARVKERVGEANVLFESLGDLMGSRDIEELSQTLNEISSKPWAKLDANAMKALNFNLRDLQATAQILDVSKAEMMDTLRSMHSISQASTGVTTNQIAMGMGGGGAGGTAAAVDMSRLVYGIAQNTGAKSPQDIYRISMQQAGLMSIGVNSTAGKAATLIEYLNENGSIDPELYERARETLKTGTIGERNEVIDDVLTKSFGSVAAGKSYLDNPMNMRMMRESMGDVGWANTVDTIRGGQSTEWNVRYADAQRTRFEQYLAGMRKQAGFEYNRDPNLEGADAHSDTIKFLGSQSDVTPNAINELNSIYSKAIAKGESPMQADQAVQEFISRDPSLKKYSNDLKRVRADEAVLRQSSDMLKTFKPGKLFDTTIKSMENFGVMRDMADPQKKKLRELERLVQTDPIEAYEQLKTFLGPVGAGHNLLSPDQRVMLNTSLDAVRRDFKGTEAQVKAFQTGRQRTMFGFQSGLSTSDIEIANDMLTESMAEYQDKIGTPDEEEASAAYRKKISYLSGVLPPEEVERYSKLGLDKTKTAQARADELQVEIDKQGQINMDQDMSTWVAMSNSGTPMDYKDAVSELQQYGGDRHSAIRAMSAGEAAFHQIMSDKSDLRATLPQLGVALAKGNIGLARMFGVEEGASVSPDIQKKWDKYSKKLGLDEFSDAMVEGRKGVA